jgi:hypothetical protein
MVAVTPSGFFTDTIHSAYEKNSLGKLVVGVSNLYLIYRNINNRE